MWGSGKKWNGRRSTAGVRQCASLSRAFATAAKVLLTAGVNNTARQISSATPKAHVQKETVVATHGQQAIKAATEQLKEQLKEKEASEANLRSEMSKLLEAQRKFQEQLGEKHLSSTENKELEKAQQDLVREKVSCMSCIHTCTWMLCSPALHLLVITA